MGTFPASAATASELTTSPVSDPHIIELAPPIQRAFPGKDLFDAIMSAEGKVFRTHKNRRTFRVEIEGARYFIKVHGYAGWREVIRNLCRLRLPVLTARPEYEAIKALTRLGVPTMRTAGYALRGRDPSKLESFIITESLDDHLTLDELAPLWRQLPERQYLQLTRRAIRELATIARTLHTNGLNHRDFYLCHFMTPMRDWSKWTPEDEMSLHVIDLHRMQIRHKTPMRWLVKDLSGLLFSVFDIDLSTHDYLRFLKTYWGSEWKQEYRRSGLLRRIIIKRAVNQYRRKQGKLSRIPVGLTSFS